MDLPSQEVEIPMPLTSVYAGAQVHGHGHGHVTNMVHQHDGHDHDHHHHHHHHHEPSPNQFPALPPSNGQNHENHHNHHDHVVVSSNSKKQVRYRECQKNHAATMGGNATDGCGEFMPSGEEGTIEALTCSACNCHRNFHRKEVEGEIPSSPPHHLMINSRGRKVINLGHHKNMLSPSEAFGGYPTATAGALVPAGGGSRSVPIIPYSMGSLMIPSDQSDDQEEGGNGASAGVRALPPPPPPPLPPPPHHHHRHQQQQQHQYYIHHHSNHHHHNQMLKKRFRTKFTPEQKEKMLNFAEKVGWKIQKQEESVVQQLCQEIGVKRRVLKVWMHNNKHSLAKKNSSTSNA